MSRRAWVIRLYAFGAVGIVVAVVLAIGHACMPLEYRAALGFVMGAAAATFCGFGTVTIVLGRDVAKGKWPL
jgi:hypothetical protein